MGIHDGRKIRRLIEAMNEAIEDGQRTWRSAMIDTLHKRPLGQMHFDTLRTECEKFSMGKHPGIIWECILDRATPDVILKAKHYFQSLVYVAPSKHDPQYFNLMAQYTSATHETFAQTQRLLPVRLESEHIERRYLERNARLLGSSTSLIPYDDKGFMGAIILGSTAALVMSHRSQNQTGMSPIFIPDTKGAYLGHALSLTHPLLMHPMTTAMVTRTGKQAQAIGVRAQQYQLATQFDPDLSHRNGCALLKTYISHAEMMPHQKELCQAFAPLLEQASDPDFVQEFLRRYTLGILNQSSPFQNTYLQMCVKVAQIMDSDAWGKEFERAAPKTEQAQVEIALRAMGALPPAP